MKRLRIFLLSVILLAISHHSPTVHAEIKEFQQPNAYAVVIGIGQYREEIIPKISYAVPDAQAMASLLEAQAGIPKAHIKVLTDSRATLSDLRNHLGEWLRMRVKADSTVYVYFAGHGTPNLQTQSGAIVPWDGHPDFPSGLYPLNELEETLSKLPTKKVVVFLDSCFSGGAGRSVIAKGARPMGLQYPVLASGEVMVLAAATGTQISSDYDKAGHGLFTAYILKGLRGEADTDKDGLVTMKELFPFVRTGVTTTALDELNREQTPVLLPEAGMLGKRDMLPLTKTGAGLYAFKVAAGQSSEQSKWEVTAPDGRQFIVTAPATATEAEVREYVKANIPKAPAQPVDTEVAKSRQELEVSKQQMAKPAPETPKPIEIAKAPAFSTPQPSGNQITGKDGAPMILVPGGEFLYGEKNQRLSLPAFYMDKFEVTTRLYDKFLQATGRSQPIEWSQQVALMGSRDRPVVNVTWHDANAYCRQYGKRLPTEQEWEKGARGTDGRLYPWGNEDPTSRHANFGKIDLKGYATLTAIGEHEAGKSPYGIYDMAGNVMEWTNPNNGINEIVANRGGSWRSSNADSLQSTSRNDGYDTSVRNIYIGFRCAQDAPK